MKKKLFGLNIGSLLKITPGGRHGWYESNLGYPIRKELREIKESSDSVKFGLYTPPSVNIPVDVHTFIPEKKLYVRKRLKSLLKGEKRLWEERFKRLFHFRRKGGG